MFHLWSFVSVPEEAHWQVDETFYGLDKLLIADCDMYYLSKDETPLHQSMAAC